MADGVIKGAIGEIREFCLHDGPGVRTTVFFRGCPLRCPWCHNPEFLCGSAGDSELCTADSVAERILRDRPIMESSGGGVTFSGGEVLMQWPFAAAIAERLDGLHIAVETSGYAPEEVYSAMVERCGLVLQDIKCMDEDMHRRLTGAGNALILKNIRYLQRSGRPYIIRMPYVEGFNGFLTEVEAMVRFVAEERGNLQKVELLPYHAGGIAKLKKLGAPVPEGLPLADGIIPAEASAILKRYKLIP